MSSEAAANNLKTKIKEALAFNKDGLEKRTEWGSVTFEKAAPDFEMIFTILNHLDILPVEHLPDKTINQITPHIDQVIAQLKAISDFTLETGNPTQARDQLASEIHGHADQLYISATPWIPFLAYQKGEVQKNIEALTSSVTDAKEIVSKAKTDIENKKSEIDNIITKAREASAGAGAAVFTEDFSKEAKTLNDTAEKWLKVTTGLAITTVILGFVMLWMFQPESGLDSGQIIHRFGTKVAILGILFTATVWCGKNYRSLMHQSAVNRHRALSLQTFQAFSHAASDDQTKDAVLMETTRSIFGNTSTGFIDEQKAGQEGFMKIVEVAKSVGGPKA